MKPYTFISLNPLCITGIVYYYSIPVYIYIVHMQYGAIKFYYAIINFKTFCAFFYSHESFLPITYLLVNV